MRVAVTTGLVGATFVGSIVASSMFGVFATASVVLLAIALVLGAAAVPLTRLPRPTLAVSAAIAAASLLFALTTGIVLPVTGSFAVNVVITIICVVPFTMALTNVEGAPGTQVTITPVMLAGAAIVGFIRGGNGLEPTALAAAGACIGVAAWCWLGRGSRLATAGSMFLAFTSLGIGCGFGGKAGISVLAIGIGLLVIPVTDFFVVVEGRRRAGNLYWGHGGDHLYDRIRARGLTNRGAIAVILGAATVGVTASCLTAGEVIVWPVGLCIAWTMKLSLTYWAVRAPLPATKPIRLGLRYE